MSAAAADVGSGEYLIVVLLDCWSVGTKTQLRSAPVSTAVQSGAEWDLLLTEAPPLGYAAMVEVWNHGVIGADQVVESFGRLSQPTAGQLGSLYSGFIEGESVTDLPTGPPVLAQEDPRRAFQRSELHRVARYWFSLTLGDRLADWLDESGNDTGDLAREAGWVESNVERLLDDRIDPRSGIRARQGGRASPANRHRGERG